MKKIILVCISLLIFTSLMIKINAEEYGFEAVVINPNGTKDYGSQDSEIIPYNAKVLVRTDGEDEPLGNIKGIYALVYYNGVKYSDIPISDIRLVNEGFIKVEEKYDGFAGKDFFEEKFVHVLKRQEIKNAPLHMAKGTGTFLEVGTDVKVKFSYMTGEYSDYWYYVEYNGVKGYISDYDGSLGFSKVKGECITITEGLMNDFNLNQEVSIKANKKVNNMYDPESLTPGYKYTGLYIEIDNYKGIYPNVACSLNETVKLTRNVKVYNSVNGKKIGTLKKGTKVNVKYKDVSNYEYCYYVESDDIKGWIVLENLDETAPFKLKSEIEYEPVKLENVNTNTDDENVVNNQEEEQKVISNNPTNNEVVTENQEKNNNESNTLSIRNVSIIVILTALLSVLITLLIVKKRN